MGLLGTYLRGVGSWPRPGMNTAIDTTGQPLVNLLVRPCSLRACPTLAECGAAAWCATVRKHAPWSRGYFQRRPDPTRYWL